MAIKITTSDKKEFDSMEAAEAHEAGLALIAAADANIEKFLDHAGYIKPEAGKKGGATRTIAKKAVSAFIAFEASRLEAE